MIGCLLSQGGQENGPCTCHLIQFKTWHIYQERAGIMKFIQAVSGVNNLSSTAFVSAAGGASDRLRYLFKQNLFSIAGHNALGTSLVWQNLLLKAILLLKFVSIVWGLWSVKAA